MKQAPDLYKKILEISNEVKQNLRKKGVVVPSKNKDGSISMGNYTVTKDNEFYNIIDRKGIPVVENINLPQTAVLMANSLAVGRNIDTQIMAKDRSYGFALFEEALTKRAMAKSKNIDKWDIMTTKHMLAQAKKNYFKEQIVSSFKNFENSYK